MGQELKQKQIEEMAKSMLEYGMEKYPTENSVCTEEKLRKQFFYVFLTYAEHLYNAGYRKIPENAVVHTREEYEALLLEQKRLREMTDRIPYMGRRLAWLVNVSFVRF